jgi:uncharacterized protein (UPF0333 family)
MHQKGLTIIQLMLILLVAGIVGAYVVDVLIEKRCESSWSKTLCEARANETK